MNNFKIYFLFFFFIYQGFSNAGLSNMHDLKELEWILDKWVSPGSDATSYEEWTKVSDTLYEGGSKTVRNGEVIFVEKLKIVYENGAVYYVADVAHNPAPVFFKLTSADSSSAVFENSEHDFPQKITYMLDNGNLHALIEGPGKEGIWKKTDFYFYKSR